MSVFGYEENGFTPIFLLCPNCKKELWYITVTDSWSCYCGFSIKDYDLTDKKLIALKKGLN